MARGDRRPPRPANTQPLVGGWLQRPSTDPPNQDPPNEEPVAGPSTGPQQPLSEFSRESFLALDAIAPENIDLIEAQPHISKRSTKWMKKLDAYMSAEGRADDATAQRDLVVDIIKKANTEVDPRGYYVRRQHDQMIAAWLALVPAIAKRAGRPITDEQVWHQDVVNNLAVPFLLLRVRITSGRYKKVIKSRTLEHWGTHLIYVIGHNTINPETGARCGMRLLIQGGLLRHIKSQIKESKTPGLCDPAVRSLSNLWLMQVIVSEGLDRHYDKKTYIGQEELKLIYEKMLGNPYNRLVKIQTLVATNTCFYTAARPGSLAASNPQYRANKWFLNLGDIEVERTGHCCWQVRWSFKHHKGWNGARGKLNEYVLQSVKCPQNVLFDAAACIITIADLCNYKGAYLRIKEDMKDQPLFLKSTPGGRSLHWDPAVPCLAVNVSRSMTHHARAAGMPQGPLGLYTIRRDTVNDFTIKFDRSTGQFLAGHAAGDTVLDMNYTRKTANVQVVGHRLGEIITDQTESVEEIKKMHRHASAALYALLGRKAMEAGAKAPAPQPGPRPTTLGSIPLTEEMRAAMESTEKWQSLSAAVKSAWEDFLSLYSPEERASLPIAVMQNLKRCVQRAAEWPEPKRLQLQAAEDRLREANTAFQAHERVARVTARKAKSKALHTNRLPAEFETTDALYEGYEELQQPSALLTKAVQESRLRPPLGSTLPSASTTSAQAPSSSSSSRQATPDADSPSEQASSYVPPSRLNLSLGPDALNDIEQDCPDFSIDETLYKPPSPQPAEASGATLGSDDEDLQPEFDDVDPSEFHAIEPIIGDDDHVDFEGDEEDDNEDPPLDDTREGNAEDSEDDAPQLGQGYRRAVEARVYGEERRQAGETEHFPEDPSAEPFAVDDAAQLDDIDQYSNIKEVPTPMLRQLFMEFLAAPVLQERARDAANEEMLCIDCQAYTHNPERMNKRYPTLSKLYRHQALHTDWYDIELRMITPDPEVFACPSCHDTFQSVQMAKKHCLTKCKDKDDYIKMRDNGEQQHTTARLGAQGTPRTTGVKPAQDIGAHPSVVDSHINALAELTWEELERADKWGILEPISDRVKYLLEMMRRCRDRDNKVIDSDGLQKSLAELIDEYVVEHD
ncbi:hypothetical protein BOTBODRAFT_168720 [Botryobasidium botryosum FD-172 SS1]|uniref:Uncharacterized protein n=1 Tax=Botryobasidium botryosum (strain FD-172 SS1) TaxID=930990 RepID=A0A067NBG1_BOTB1|nr:hypothetical protein BOTBODRAFT_168720 [Botryobasidium botryosum FD-172 SS1]